MSIKKMSDKDLIRIIKESYEEHLQKVNEELDVLFPINGKQENVLSKGLKIRNKKGDLFTVDAIGDWGAYLIPAGKGSESSVKVSTEDLEDDYEL